MARIPTPSRDQIPDEFKDAFDQAVANIGGQIGAGPWPVVLNSPELALRRINLADYLRKETHFPKKIQELAILIAIRAMDCQYAWNAHTATATGWRVWTPPSLTPSGTGRPCRLWLQKKKSWSTSAPSSTPPTK